ncbi:UNVERIFIED_CONTAM: hypothetical protein GTU68_023208 [Idotea baltica]|nr:hypothetical protein [Idotea baltica]
MMPFLTENFGNPSAIHTIGRRVRSAVEKARKSMAKLIHASTAEIFFTSSATEANNTVLCCAVRDLGVKHIITSPIEHHCILHTAEQLEKEGLIQHHLIKVDCYGKVDIESLKSLIANIGEEKILVSIMHANNEIGTLNDIAVIGTICKENNVLFHSDTVQTFAHFPINTQELNIDFLVGSAHKFHGPKGIGFLYISGDTSIKPLIFGGAQERNMRAGTENVPGIIGMAKAAELAYGNLEKDKEYISNLKQTMKQKLQQNFEGLSFNGDPDGNSLYTVLSVSFPPHPKNSMLLINLDISGVCASGGSACSSGVDVGSHVLTCLGMDTERANVRFSFSKFNTVEEIDIVIGKLKEILS